MAETSTGMDRAEMKAMLNKATVEKPINFAFGFAKDPNLALLKLDKLKNPKAVDKMLGAEFSELKASRWGTVAFDEGDDVLKFQVNKPLSGAARKLAKTLKGTGFAKVQIVLEDGTVAEEAGGEEEEEGQPTTAAPQADRPGAAPDPATLVAELTALVRKVPAAIAADPSLKEQLSKLAAAAGSSINADPQAAPAAIAALRDALARARPAAAASAAPSNDQAAEPDRAKVTASLKDAMQHIPAAIAANPAAKDALTKLAGEAVARLKTNDLAGVASLLKQLQDALEPQGDDLGERIADLMAQASVLPEPVRSELLGRAKQLKAQPDPAGLELLATDIGKAAGAARAAQAKQEAGNTVTLRILQKKWNQAEAQAEKQLDAFLDDLLGDPDLQDDERFADLQAAANGYRALIPDDGGALTAALGELDDADAAARPALLKKAVAALEKYRSDLAASHELETLQSISDEYYGGKPFLRELELALKDLGAELSK